MKNHTEKEIVKILMDSFGVDPGPNDCFSIPLTAPPFKLEADDLYRLLMLVEEQYRIFLSPKLIRERGFQTIRDIANIVQMATQA